MNSLSSTGRKFKILVVEDEEDSKEILVSLLQTTNEYEVYSASSGNEALTKMEAESDKFNLVLLDIVMSNLDGIETLRMIKADKSKYGNPFVVMLTNLGGDVAVETAINLGADGYLMKIETEPEVLLKKVAEYAQKQGI